MMISGYPIGTTVKWDEEEGFCTGIVRGRYYNPGQYEVDGHTIDIEIVEKSPQYAVEDNKKQQVIVMPHNKVFKQS